MRRLGLRRIAVFDPYAADDLTERLARLTGAQVTRAHDTAGVADAEIVVTASRSKDPLFAGERIAEGAFVAAIGSSLPHTRELDDAALARASQIAVEWKKQALTEAGDLVLADPALQVASKVVELGDIVCGKHAGLRSGAGIRLYKAVGVGLEDIALAGVAYQNYQKNSA